MSRELNHQLERLGQERHRLEVHLSRQPNWLAWKQLSEMNEPTDDFGRYMFQRRKAELESELLRDPLFSAHRSVISAMQIFERLIGPRLADDPRTSQNMIDEKPSSTNMNGAAIDDDKAEQLESSTPAASAQCPDHASANCPSREIEATTLADLRGSVTKQSATIHISTLWRGIEQPTSEDADRPPDQLTRIRRIDKDLAAALIARGVRHFAQIAAFGPADVRALSAALGLGRRISQENWIEQAAMLAIKANANEATKASGRLRQRPSFFADGQSSAGKAQPQSRTAGVTGSHNGTDSRQRPVATVVNAIANAIAGHRDVPQDIHQDVPVHAPQATPSAVASRLETTTEQAAAATIAEEAARSCDAPPLEAEREGAALARELVRDAASRIAKAMQVGRDIEFLSATAGKASAVPDDLELISGISNTIAARLRADGVTRFDEIAEWNAASVARYKAKFGPAVPISRLNWIEQAALLARGAATAYATRRVRGEYAAVVRRPIEFSIRHEAFAAWLAAHSRSHATPAVTIEPLAQPHSDDVITSKLLAKAASVQPIDVEFEEVSREELDAASRAVGIDALNSLRPPRVEFSEAYERVGAGLVHPCNIIDIKFDVPEQPRHECEEVDEFNDVECNGKPNAAAAVPVRPVKIADRITEIERDAAELSEPSRLVLDEFKQGRSMSSRHAAFTEPVATRSEACRSSQKSTPAENPGTLHQHTVAATIAVDEAFVHIVARKQNADRRAMRDKPHADSIHNRTASDFSASTYAAFRESVEEANVEIVPVDASHSQDSQTAAAGECTAPEHVDASSPRSEAARRKTGKFRRFLNTLLG